MGQYHPCVAHGVHDDDETLQSSNQACHKRNEIPSYFQEYDSSDTLQLLAVRLSFPRLIHNLTANAVGPTAFPFL